MLARLVLLLPPLGFVIIAVLLMAGHHGFATKVTDYFFWVLLAVVLLGLLKK